MIKQSQQQQNQQDIFDPAIDAIHRIQGELKDLATQFEEAGRTTPARAIGNIVSQLDVVIAILVPPR